jgi:hypothetical protein
MNGDGDDERDERFEEEPPALPSRAAFEAKADGSSPVDAAAPPVESDLEELEAAEEAEEAPQGSDAETAGPSDDASRDLAAMLSAGEMKSWTLDEMLRIVEEARSSIVMEDGVFRIKEEVYTASEQPKERPGRPGRTGAGLRELAEQVVRHGSVPAKRAAAAPATPVAPVETADQSAPGSIGDLLSDEDSLDLSNMVSQDKEVLEGPLPMDQERRNPVHLKRNGLDYDAFLSSYPRSFTMTTQMKSLVELSRRVAAVSAVILLKKVRGYSPDLTVGVNEKTIRLLTFNSAEAIFAELLVPRKAVLVDRSPAESKIFKTKYDAEDLKYTKRVALLPATFRGQEAYLLFSFSSETGITINSLLSRLLVQ